MMTFSIHLLGDFLLLADGAPVTGLHQARLQSLLAYLLFHRHAPQSRQQLAFLFWPDSTESQARTNLRKALHAIRSVVPNAERFLQGDANTIQWRPDAPFALDVAEFEHKIAQAHAVAHSGRTADGIALLTEAVTLYRGELLPGCYDDWALTERERLHQLCLAALEQLMAWLEDEREYAAAIRHGQRLLLLDPVDEATYRRLMRLHTLHGDRAGALRIYHTCVDVLQRELDVEPSVATHAFYTRLIQQGAPVAGPVRTLRRTDSTRLVGRGAEWRQLQGAWRRATNAHAYFALVAGEAGIGKTRLVEAMRDWAVQQGITTAHARAYAAEGGLAYAPVIDWLRSAPFRTVLPQLEPVWRCEVARLLPELLAHDPTLPHPEPLTERWQRQRLFEALTRAIWLATPPLLLALDDLQWCDMETLEWLHFLLRYTPDMGTHPHPAAYLLVVGTVRPEEVDDQHPLTPLLLDLRRSGQVAEIDLGPLTADETATLAAQVAGQELDRATLQRLYQTSEGNPLFIVEMVRAARSREEETGGEANNAPAALPPKVAAVIQSRLRQLSPAARASAHLAAVIGRSFTFAVLAQASGADEEALVQALDELWQRRIVREENANAYDFSHDRMREVAYATLRPAQRRHLHRRVAEALETLHAADLDSVSGQLATHYEQAGAVESAIIYYERAAGVAQRIFAYTDADAYLNRLLVLLDELPTTAEHNERRLDALLQKGEMLAMLRGVTVPEIEAIHREARALCYNSAQIDKSMLALRGMWVYWSQRCQWPEAASIEEEMLQLAQQSQDSYHLHVAFGTVATRLFHQGKLREADYQYQRAATLFSSHPQPTGLFQSLHGPDSPVLIRWTIALWLLGYPEQAQACMAERLKLARRPLDILFKLDFSMWLTHELHQVQRIRALYQEYLAMLEKHPFPELVAQERTYRGWFSVWAGDYQNGILLLKQGLLAWQEMGIFQFITYLRTWLIEAYLWAEQFEQGLVVVAEALALVEETDERFWHAELYRLQGELLLAQGSAVKDVEACFQQAINIARQQEAKSLELRAAMSLAYLWQRQGKENEAHALLAPIYGWFTEGFDTADLQEAKALLDALHTST